MYLKRLEIKGFKSFAEKTVLDFFPYKNNRYSITAVVGPNGSGKSNVADAIRWVMGEQSLKNLRGKKNEDIIFSGSQVKGQLGAAEVTMVLDNSVESVGPEQNRIMSDYPEITVSRRLYRSGEGEYLINNNPVRLLDIYLFLAQAQFAQHSYSVVGQGMIDKLLTVSPAERKDFLDEASGIKEFQIKQHQADLKLTRTRENLTQAQRLVEEVEPRLKILARQVKKLEQRQEVELKLRENQEKYYASIYLVNKSELDRLNLVLAGVETNYREAFKELEEAQREMAALARDAAETEEKSKNSAGQMIHEQRKLLDQIAKDKTSAQLKIFNLEKQIFQDQSEQNYRQVSGLFAAQAVLENKDKFGQVDGLVAQLGEVEEQYQLALEVAAGSYLSALVVESDEVAKRAIEFLRNNRLGSATFLPLNKINPRPAEKDIGSILSMPGVVGLAADIIKHEDKFNNIFSFIFGQTVVVESLAAAQKIGIGRARMVTLTGDLVEKTGVMKGGYKHIKKDGLRFSSHISWSKDRLAEYQAQINSEKEKIIQFEAEYEQAKAALLELESKREAANSKTKLLKAFSLQEVMQKKQNLVNEILAKRNDLKIEAARLETKQTAISEEVQAEINSTIEAIVERQPPQVSAHQLPDVLGEIQKLKYQLSLIGGIDKEVVEEYEQSKERFDFLSDQIKDLTLALADLEKMILELDEIMKKKRAASFKKIRKEFDRYVKILFGGGDGDIFEIYGEEKDEDEMSAESMGEETPEEKPKRREKILTGIDISINPPGKKIKNISTLSGGERTLVSIALICAILSYNPAPFVVLDEVEAALDESNTRRFAEILAELSSRSQFIIITHNRVTMHAADALYGVVMGNDGISKLLSVKLEEVPKYETAVID
ncbi:MAG: AAA family ATPase [Candidatus Magasanikbacteria bacterium]|nr:AAA family ATPase [Candidatus Magasanikbacteria bacterium]